MIMPDASEAKVHTLQEQFENIHTFGLMRWLSDVCYDGPVDKHLLHLTLQTHTAELAGIYFRCDLIVSFHIPSVNFGATTKMRRLLRVSRILPTADDVFYHVCVLRVACSTCHRLMCATWSDFLSNKLKRSYNSWMLQTHIDAFGITTSINMEAKRYDGKTWPKNCAFPSPVNEDNKISRTCVWILSIAVVLSAVICTCGNQTTGLLVYGYCIYYKHPPTGDSALYDSCYIVVCMVWCVWFTAGWWRCRSPRHRNTCHCNVRLYNFWYRSWSSSLFH